MHMEVTLLQSFVGWCFMSGYEWYKKPTVKRQKGEEDHYWPTKTVEFGSKQHRNSTRLFYQQQTASDKNASTTEQHQPTKA